MQHKIDLMCGSFNKANGNEAHGYHIKIENKGFIHLVGVVTSP
jgi:hypothetical protein